MVAAEVDVAVVPEAVAAVVPGTVAAVPEAVVAKGAVGVPWRVAVLVSEAARNSTQVLRPPRGRLSRALVGCLTLVDRTFDSRMQTCRCFPRIFWFSGASASSSKRVQAS